MKPTHHAVDPGLLAAVYARAAVLGVRLPNDATAIAWAMARAAGVGLTKATPAAPGVCEGCLRSERPLGRFVDDSGKEWAALCGGCKIRITMTPRRRQNLARLAKACMEAPTGPVIDTIGEAIEAPALPTGEKR